VAALDAGTDWLEELDADLSAVESEREAALAAKVDHSVARILGTGPLALAGMTEAELLELINPKLRSFATTYQPCQGGALLLGPTSTGKTTAAVVAVKHEVRRIHEGGSRQTDKLDGWSTLPEIYWARAAALTEASSPKSGRRGTDSLLGSGPRF